MPERFREQRVDGPDSGGMPAENKFGTKLKQLILSRGIKTQNDFSRKICVPNSDLNTWINGHDFPRVEAMGKILVSLKPEGEDLDVLMTSWGQFLLKRRRRDNVAGIPYGGIPGKDPLGIAIYNLMLKSGKETQKDFAKAICESRSMVSFWIRGENIPSPEVMGKILIVTKPDDGALDSLMVPWADKLQESKGRMHITGKKTSFDTKMPFAKWVADFIVARDISVRSFAINTGFVLGGLSAYERMSVQSMVCVIEKMRSEYRLDDKKLVNAYEVVAQTIEERAARGARVVTESSGMRMRSIRDTHYPKRYLMGDVAEMLSVSTRKISKIMRESGIAQPMKRKDVMVIAEHLGIDPKDKWTR